tara:strand:- start:849 stop:1037 length:189 start_codon:yes stop_codon:yes gene_type:complete
MNMKKVLSTALLGLASEYPFSSPYHDVKGRGQKFQYAGLSKQSPSHAQQKRDSKKAKNKVSK